MDPAEQAAIIGKMNVLLDDELPDDEFAPPLEAHRIIEKLREEDPGLLFDYLDVMAETLLLKIIGDRRRSLRNAWLRSETRRAFAGAAASGDLSQLDPYRELAFIVEGGAQKPLGKLTSNDLSFVANAYQVRGNRELTLAALHNELAARVAKAGPNATLESAVPRQQYLLLVTSLGVSKILPPPAAPTV